MGQRHASWPEVPLLATSRQLQNRSLDPNRVVSVGVATSLPCVPLEAYLMITPNAGKTRSLAHLLADLVLEPLGGQDQVLDPLAQVRQLDRVDAAQRLAAQRLGRLHDQTERAPLGAP